MNASLKQRAGERPRDVESGRNELGHRKVALASELEGGQLDLERLAMLVPGPELQPAKVEARHLPG